MNTKAVAAAMYAAMRAHAIRQAKGDPVAEEYLSAMAPEWEHLPPGVQEFYEVGALAAVGIAAADLN